MTDGVTVQGRDQLLARLQAVDRVAGSPMLRRLQMAAVREQKLLVPRKTANLGRSIHAGPVTETVALTFAGASYAPYVEFGTRKHDIRPRYKKALRWAASSSKGYRLSGKPSAAKGNQVGWAFSRLVHHPGTRPHPFMLPGALLAVRKTGLANIVIEAWNAGA